MDEGGGGGIIVSSKKQKQLLEKDQNMAHLVHVGTFYSPVFKHVRTKMKVSVLQLRFSGAAPILIHLPRSK